MIRGWGRSLLFSSICIGFIFLLCISFCTEYARAEAEVIVVTPDPINVEFEFDKPKGTVFSLEKYINIENKGNDTLRGSISHSHDGIRILPSHYEILQGESKRIILKIEADSNALDLERYSFEIEVEGVNVLVNAEITYHAMLDVSPLSIDFGEVGRKKSPSTTIEIKEALGYKSAENVRISRISGNSWVEPERYDIGAVSTSGVHVNFQMKSEKHPDHNRYSWEYKITSGNAGSATINIQAYILMPPKLGRLYDEELEIKFDKPKGTVRKYYRDIDVRVRNEGDETMYFNSWFTEYPSWINIAIENPSGEVSGKNSKNIRVHIIAPYDAPERTYRGKLHVDTTDKGGKYNAGHGDVDITIKIIWPVDFIVSSTSPYFTSSPLSIDFDSLELKELGYEKKRINITLTEFYHYKSVRNLRFSKSGEYGKWLHDNKDFSEIPPSESRNFTLKIEPGLEAVPKSYSWKYDISASEISRKRLEIRAKIVPMNIPEMIEYLNAFRESILYTRYPSSEVIISNGVGMLEVVDESEISAEDWKKIPVLMKGTLSLLSSLNDGIAFSEEGNYGKAVENLVSASVSTSTIGSNSELNNWDISGYAKDISTGADKTTGDVLIDEAKKLEGRGWNIKKAVEHAMAMDDIRGLKDEENVLESALSYQYAATIYGLLNDKEKRIECNYEESLLMDKHDELVSDATDRRIKAENKISNSKENDLIRIGDIYLLLNPYKYDTFSESYGSAEKYLEDALKNYKVAGESLMSEDTEKKLNDVKREWSYILSLFLFACILYGAAFFYTITRVIMGTMAYMRDMYEREVGDIIVK